jgi:uncharacterized membrane protein
MLPREEIMIDAHHDNDNVKHNLFQIILLTVLVLLFHRMLVQWIASINIIFSDLCERYGITLILSGLAVGISYLCIHMLEKNKQRGAMVSIESGG